jgi:alpha-galactosidase
VLLGLFQRHGIRSFKLDGIKLRTRLGEARFGRFLDALEHGSGGRIVVVLDVTSEVRQGYFREIEHGVLFLENRYTDWGNYYPYRTLRNVWQLSRWIPAQRLHIECLNPQRNASVYGGDPFAPQRYPISYLYAITMIGHPLAWMEVQHLDAADSAALRHVADWHAANHQRLLTADIQPVGELPNGRSWTGFRFAFPDGHCGLLVFRDSTEREESVFTIDHAGPFIQRAGNTEATTGSLPRGRLRLRLPARRSWAFLETGTTSSD